ncbi:hypothetical protein HK101_010628 [Irineochytrium annulatum]|nr:hypothetical protein HK101_010628 [Irineochytrium annulatum]
MDLRPPAAASDSATSQTTAAVLAAAVDPPSSFYEYPETPSQVAYARQHDLIQNQPTPTGTDVPHFAFDAQGNPIQLFDQSGQPLNFHPTTRAFHDPQGVQVHVEVTQLLFDQFGAPIVLSTSPPTMESGGFNTAGANVVAKQPALIDPTDVEVNAVAQELERLKNDVHRRKDVRKKYILLRIGLLVLGVLIVAIIAIASSGVLKPKSNNSGSNSGGSFTGPTPTVSDPPVSTGPPAGAQLYQLRNPAGMCLAANTSDSVKVVTRECEASPDRNATDSSTTSLVHSTNRYLCAQTGAYSVQLADPVAPTPFDSLPGDCGTNHYRIGLDNTTNTMGYTPKGSSARVCIDVNVQIEDDNGNGVCDLAQTWSPIPAGRASSTPPPPTPQSYQLQSSAGCLAASGIPKGDFNATVAPCEVSPAATSPQLWHAAPGTPSNSQVSVLFPFHALSGKRVCHPTAGATHVGSDGSFNDFCLSGDVFMVPAAAGAGLKGAMRVTKASGTCLGADLSE